MRTDLFFVLFIIWVNETLNNINKLSFSSLNRSTKHNSKASSVKHTRHTTWSWMNKISASGEARLKLTNSISIFKRPSKAYAHSVMLMVSSTGDFFNKNLMNSISCGTPDISVIFTTLRLPNAQSEGHCFSQKSKSDPSIAAKVFEEPYVGSKPY